MKKFKFRSLTMRIWTTFTAFILIIICSITFVYMFAYRRTREKAVIADLKVAHGMVLDSEDGITSPDGLRRFGNLKNSRHFLVVADDSWKPEVDANGYPVVPSNSSSKIEIPVPGIPIEPSQNDNPAPPSTIKSDKGLIENIVDFVTGDKGFTKEFNDKELKKWMIKLISEGKASEKQLQGYYKGRKYFMIVSSKQTVNGTKEFLISYVPSMEDNTLLYTVLSIGIVFIIIGFFTSKMIANYLSKPLKQLEEYTKKISHKDWTDPIEVKTEDEIGRLVTSMNVMQTELQKIDREEKLFLQSISHDLKTPVMVIMSHADAIIDGVYIDSVEKTAEIIRDEAISLEKKIKQMLYLNTLDYVMNNTNEDTEINFHKLIIHIVNRFEVVKSDIDWNLDIDEVNIFGNIDKIQVAVENILDNGLRYAKEQVSVTLKKQGGYAVLDIYNDGPSIDQIHMNRIFDNMYKDKTGNFGLGLAISKKIINFYKGEISAKNREKGVSFIIKFPIAESVEIIED
ncbi:HAMP domain-containing sensor histidine kinase [Clostridium sp. C8-1-8]|uniref:HAMP domain-containing sensor histidine kinase n=1 Tax=Clostridium sp. C8-1-8 TaxID=2698831 RepID=UPI001370DCFC|nr:HAMP domain-containing sensor histidine kinase [Clostridium sp. C8-1-8]